MEKEKDVIKILCKGIKDKLCKQLYCDKITVEPFVNIAQEGKYEDIYVQIERKGFKFNYLIVDAYWGAYYGVTTEKYSQEIIAKYKQALMMTFF